jgi:hypothetical protein
MVVGWVITPPPPAGTPAAGTPPLARSSTQPDVFFSSALRVVARR